MTPVQVLAFGILIGFAGFVFGYAVAWHAWQDGYRKVSALLTQSRVDTRQAEAEGDHYRSLWQTAQRRRMRS